MQEKMMKQDYYYLPCTKLNHNHTNGLIIRPDDILKLKEKKVGKTHQLIGMGKDFLNWNPVAHKVQTATDKTGSH